MPYNIEVFFYFIENEYKISHQNFHIDISCFFYIICIILIITILQTPMPYKSPKDLQQQFWTSLKTIYNYLSRYPNKIRTKKEFWKTVVNIEDFKSVFQKTGSNYNLDIYEDSKTLEANKEVSENESNLKLQKEYNLALQKNEDLQKYNSNLTEQVNKYALLLSEEKQEKKAWEAKYDNLNQSHFETIERFTKESLQWSRNFYMVLGICIALLLSLWFVLLPSLTKRLQSF